MTATLETRLTPVPPPRAAPRPPIAALSRSRIVAAGVLAGMGVLFAWFLAYAFVLSPLQEHHSQGVLYSQLRQKLSEQTAPVGGTPINEGTPIGLIDFPAAGLHRVVIVEGTAAGDLMKGPGHSRNTVLPGQAGVSVILGRAQLFGAPFGGIASAPVGSTITVTTGEGRSTYKVTNIVRAGQPNAAPVAAGGGQLVLGTADSNGWSPSKVVTVVATLTGKPYGGSAGTQIAKSEEPMKGDPGALYVLVLWIPVLLAAVLATLWAAVRWGRWQAYIVGIPIILGALWGVSQSAVQLLPNLM